MILSDRDIKRYIKIGKISILPEPKIEGSSVDLRLADKFKMVSMNCKDCIDPKLSQALEVLKLEPDGSFMMYPGTMVLGATMEKIMIDDSVSAFVQGRSSYARMGLAIEIAGFVDAGFHGTITLEMINTSRYPIKLYPGERICQIIFVPMSSKPEMPYSKKNGAKYNGQIDPEGSRILTELTK